MYTTYKQKILQTERLTSVLFFRLYLILLIHQTVTSFFMFINVKKGASVLKCVNLIAQLNLSVQFLFFCQILIQIKKVIISVHPIRHVDRKRKSELHSKQLYFDNLSGKKHKNFTFSKRDRITAIRAKMTRKTVAPGLFIVVVMNLGDT